MFCRSIRLLCCYFIILITQKTGVKEKRVKKMKTLNKFETKDPLDPLDQGKGPDFLDTVSLGRIWIHIKLYGSESKSNSGEPSPNPTHAYYYLREHDISPSL